LRPALGAHSLGAMSESELAEDFLLVGSLLDSARRAAEAVR
jgi:hypothetical protein